MLDVRNVGLEDSKLSYLLTSDIIGIVGLD
jgi:hypothetical protein